MCVHNESGITKIDSENFGEAYFLIRGVIITQCTYVLMQGSTRSGIPELYTHGNHVFVHYNDSN